MKIQLTKTKSVDWTMPWERQAASIEDVVGIEIGSGNPEGCPAVRLQRRNGTVQAVAVGFVANPNGTLPTTWDELSAQPKWSIPSAFRAECAALAINSSDSTTRQTAIDSLLTRSQEGVASSKDGVRSVYRRLADTTSALQVSLPEYQALWLNRLLPEGRRPTAVSLQTAISSVLCSMAVQPGFCENADELVVYVTQASIFVVGYRKGLPLLFRECPGAAGSAAMRTAVKLSLGLDDSMLDTVFSSNSIIDTRPALEPLLVPVVGQVELSLNYLKSRLASDPKRILLMGYSAGRNALYRVMADRFALPIEMPNAFDGIALPVKPTVWKDKYCEGDRPQIFLSALGAALSVLGETR